MSRPRLYARKDIDTGKVKKVCVGKTYPRKKPFRICGVVKHLSSFYYLRTTKAFHSYCKSCQSNYMADRYALING
jgi:hypothetical protein